MELHVQKYRLPEAISFNFEELKTAITEKTEQYTSIVYTEENIKVAKADRADLNRLKKALNDERIRRQKEYMKPFDDFKTKIDEIISIIDKPVQKIDENIKYYESILQDQKRQNIEEMFKNMLFPEWMTVDQIWNQKWLNASTSMTAIESELLSFKNEVIRNCQTLATLPMHSHEAVITYHKTLDMAQALDKVHELIELEEAKKKMLAKEEAKKRETENAFIPVPEQSPVIEVERIQEEEEAAPEPKMWVGFEAYLNKTQAALLKDFFNENNIDFRPVRIKED